MNKTWSMVVNANLTVSDDYLIDFESRICRTLKLEIPGPQKLENWENGHFVRLGQTVNFTFWVQKWFFSKSESCTILVNRFRIDLSI